MALVVPLLRFTWQVVGGSTIGGTTRTKNMKDQLSQFAVYTIRSASKLRDISARGGIGQFSEHKKWVAARGLFEQVTKAGARLPIIFADAGNAFDSLIYYAFISDLSMDQSTTTYSFEGLRHIDSKLPKSSLRLRSTGAPLSDDYIRPYAIVHRPDYICAA